MQRLAEAASPSTLLLSPCTSVLILPITYSIASRPWIEIKLIR